jgi:DNA-binding transcriptional regulator YdaS (Cro superfamily)
MSVDQGQQASNQPTSSQSSPDSSANAATGFDPQDYSNLKEELARTKQTIGELNSSKATVDKLRQVFSPEEAAPEQDKDEAFLDHYLQASLEAEKEGRPIPLTTNLAVKLFETQKQLKDAVKVINELKGKTDQALDPVARVDQQTYANLDNLLQSSLYDTYGRENVSPQRFSSIASEITGEIKRLQQESPDIWEDVRRSPKAQRAMVTHFVNKNIPPAAKQLLDREAISQYKMTETDLLTAFREAKEIQDPKAREKIQTKIRQDLLEARWKNQNRRRG